MQTQGNRKRWMSVIGAAAAGAVALSVAWHASPSAQADHDGHIEVSAGEGRQFVWPMTSWIAADDHYNNGDTHHGSADLSAPHYTPVHPARPGTVDPDGIGYNERSGWNLRIVHETLGEQTYYTTYVHLSDEPLVEPGQEVGLDTLLGHVSKTGNAESPHLHFGISIGVDSDNREWVQLPETSIGDWAQSGEYIPGIYDEFEADPPDGLEGSLDPLPAEATRDFDAEVVEPEGLWLYESPGRSEDDQIVELTAGETVTVTGSQNGQYHVETGGETGWLPVSGLHPEASQVQGGVVVDEPMNIRRTPDTSEDRIGYIPGDGQLLTVVGDNGNGWSLVFWPCTDDTNRSEDPADDGAALGGCDNLSDDLNRTSKYGWIGNRHVDATMQFRAAVRTGDAGSGVYANRVVDGQDQPDCPCNSDADSYLGIQDTHVFVTVTGTYNGWYKFDYEGQTGWIRGWETTTRA